MMLKALFKTKFILVMPLLLTIGLLSFVGCDDSGIEPEPPVVVDTNVYIYKDLSVNYYVNASNDTLFIAANLLSGNVVQQQDAMKDMALIDEPIGLNQDFRFRTGDDVLDAVGKRTKFYRLFHNAEQILFDTLSKIDYSGTLDSLDFTQYDTYGGGAWNYFNYPLTEKPIYSFYLEGKFAYGITQKRIYGMFYMKNAELLAGGTRFTFDVKINKNGEDKFVK